MNGASARDSRPTAVAVLDQRGDWTIGGLTRRSWQKLPGFKGPFWLAAIVYVVTAAGLDVVLREIWPTGVSGETYLDETLRQVLTTGPTLPMIFGLQMMGVDRALGRPITAESVIRYYPRLGKLVGLWLLCTLVVVIGTALLVVPGIYLSVSYSLAPILVLEYGLGPWAAMEASRKAIGRCFGRYVALCGACALAVVASAVVFGIGLIWTVPFLAIVGGEAARAVLGHRASTPDAEFSEQARIEG